jgi:murein DD-endopeptidase MepM/ murein hydrolase activator NlpD
LLNAMSGVVRVLARPRSTGPDRIVIGPARPATARRLHRRAIGLARFLADTLTATPRARERAVAVAQSRVRDREPRGSYSARRRLYRRRRFVLRLTTDRALPLVIALIVLAAAGVSLAPAATPVGAAQGALADEPASLEQGNLQNVRLAVGGGFGAGGPSEFDGPLSGEELAAVGPPIDDATLYKPVAVDTSVKSSAGMLQHYTVKEGDTLTGVSSRFGVSMMTVWWANNLTTKDSLKVGSDLVIPPVNGLVVTVNPGDTLESLAAAKKIEVADIIEVNQLEDPNLIVGQVLVLPGAKGDPMPTPKPTAKPRVTTGGGGGGSTPVYSGGAWAWPVAGGYISQYFQSGHYGVDIAADYGTIIVAPLAGRVIFSGWKSNGGGYQVWISHGNGIYTSQNHMSAVLVAAGQSVSRGQRVGRVGTSGWASGPHDHIEVWIGSPWESGAYRVNPLRYY